MRCPTARNLTSSHLHFCIGGIQNIPKWSHLYEIMDVMVFVFFKSHCSKQVILMGNLSWLATQSQLPWHLELSSLSRIHTNLNTSTYRIPRASHFTLTLAVQKGNAPIPVPGGKLSSVNIERKFECLQPTSLPVFILFRPKNINHFIKVPEGC